MQKHMLKYCNKHKIQVNFNWKQADEELPFERREFIGFEDKLELSDQIRKVTHDVLGQITSLVQAECNNAIEDLDDERLRIRLDDLDIATFNKIRDLVNRNLIEDRGPYKRIRTE